MEGMGIPPGQIPQLTEKLFDDQGQSLAGLIAKHQKPLVGFTFHSHEELSIQKLRHHGIPVFPSPDRAARAMAALVHYSLLFEKL
jgi:acyl-CoA synthetase (NDP forming)